MGVKNIQRVLLDIIGLGGSFALVVMISTHQTARQESELREFININQRLLHYCYVYEGDGVPTLLPAGGYRAQCTMDYDGLFIIEDYLEIPSSTLQQD
ncbi:hypothetical protein N9M22_04755 [Litoricolaceae bacterium]|nr:hypothetical protein [Litorivicinaceae bacterium]